MPPPEYPPTLRQMAIAIHVCQWMADNDDPADVVASAFDMLADAVTRRLITTMLAGEV